MSTEPDLLSETLSVTTAPEVVLEATIGYHDDTTLDRMVVLFPPHPCLGGDSANNVITALFREAVSRGALAMSFDYRGVREGHLGGRSLLAVWDDFEAAGRFDPVVADALAVIGHVRDSVCPSAALWYAGYSFGSLVALQAAHRLRPEGLAGISPPLLAYDLAPWLALTPPPRWWLAPTDVFCPTGALEGLGVEPRHIHVFPGDDHFFRGTEPALAQAVLGDLLGAAAEPIATEGIST